MKIGVKNYLTQILVVSYLIYCDLDLPNKMSFDEFANQYNIYLKLRRDEVLKFIEDYNRGLKYNGK